MKKMMKRLGSGTLAMLLTLSLVLALAKMAPVADAKAASDGFQNLNQTAIVKNMGAGWNLGNQLEAVNDGVPGETNWGNPVITEDLIKLVKKSGFKSVRIPVSYIKKIGEAPDYTIDAAWLNRVQEVVDYCVNNGLYAIINIHGDGYQSIKGGWLYCNSADQDTIKKEYQAVWKQISTKFKDYDEHLIYESMNEVSDMSYSLPTKASQKTAYQNINDYNQIFVDTVRTTGGNNDKRWLLIPGWNTEIAATAGNYGFVIPTDTHRSTSIPAKEKRLMISVHDYQPWDFAGATSDKVTQWGEEAKDESKVATYGKQNAMASEFKQLKNVFTSKGYPVIIGEYGSVDKTHADSQNTFYRCYFDRKICEYSKANGCIPIYWDNGYNGKYGFALFDRAKLTVTQPEIIKTISNVMNGTKAVKGKATSISLNKKTLTVKIGANAVTLKATLKPAKCKDTVVWTSSDESVATVTSTGAVRGYTAGTAVITATVNGKKATCKVTVKAR